MVLSRPTGFDRIPPKVPPKQTVMGKLAVTSCENAKPGKARDRLMGDGDGLFLRIRPHGTKTCWLIEYTFGSARRKYTIGVYDKAGAKGESITEWLRAGRQSLAQARAIAGMWKMTRRAGHDPIVEWEAQLAAEQREAEELKAAQAAEEAQPTEACGHNWLRRHTWICRSSIGEHWSSSSLAPY